MKAETKIWYGFEDEKEEENKANTAGSETRWYSINPAVVGISRFVGRQSGGNRKSRER